MILYFSISIVGSNLDIHIILLLMANLNILLLKSSIFFLLSSLWTMTVWKIYFKFLVSYFKYSDSNWTIILEAFPNLSFSSCSKV